MALALALVGFALAVLLHGLAMRVPARFDSVRRFLLIGVPLGAAVMAVSLAWFGLTIPGVAGILLYALLCELYIFLFTLVLSSVSATMLIMLRNGSIDATRTTAAYDPREMVDLRIERMIKVGLIQRCAGQPAVTEKGATVNRAFAALRRHFGHGR